MASILIAEDEIHIIRLLTLWLNRHGHKVTGVCNGAAALEALKRESIDLIICDMNMPVLDGAGLARAVREDMGLELPILVITARCDQASIIKKMEPYGVKLYPKPFVPSQLVADIERELGAVSPGENR